MAIGTCDPASRGDTFNSGELVQGDVSVSYRYGWDGTSVRPECVGPLIRVRVVNNSATVTWYAHFQGRRGQWRRLDMPPGFTNTYGTQALTNAGFVDNTDLEGLYITTDLTPPPQALAAAK